MSEKKINPTVKFLLEFGPIILFFVVYTMIKDNSYTFFGQSYEGFIVATAGFIPLILLTTGIMWWLTGELGKMQVVTAVLVVVFGGLSVWLNDERFFKMKPTIIYLLFAGVLGFGLMRGQSYLRMIMDQMLPMDEQGWMILTKRFAVFFVGLAVANEAIWRLMSTDAWVNFKTFGLTAAMFVFMILQSGLLQRHSTVEEDA